MIPDGTYTAVVDRIEDTLATLQLEGDDDLYNLVIGEEELPEPARHADAILDVELEDEELVRADYDEAETEARRDKAQSRFDRLSERPPRDDEDSHSK
ncbi:DUF3006 domain-containing protein [Halosimplex aquaticum]|uniref:DUF3006 domain-containing protein n=1 Tax=Halosimplex aquaticum TaxID=3026162 RepID=A0ABD5XTP8_9EURY|nr:DUF3006 domain-containing protein [Halosimplex aquaticum]